MTKHLTVVDHPLVQHKLSLMREVETPTAVFRQLLREISMLLAYEVTRELPMTTHEIQTPLEKMDAPTLDGRKLALISILRAGNGLLDGVLELIPLARVGFVGLYRDEETLQPVQVLLQGAGSVGRTSGDRGRPDAGDGQLLGRCHRPVERGRGKKHPVPLPACCARRRGAHERGAPGRTDCHSVPR